MKGALRAGVGACGLLCALIAGATGAARVAAAGGTGVATRTAPAAPLPNAETIGQTTFVALPMGELANRLDTFWQLFSLTTGAHRWTLVTPPGVADNGGLFLGAANTDVLVGFGASNRLAFSPLAISPNGGRSWSPGELPHAIAAVPDALAASTQVTVALVGGESARTVLTSTSPLASWHPLLTTSALDASDSAASCRATAITAVAVAGSDALLGTSCARPGVVGVFASHAGKLHLVGPALPEPLLSGTADVLRLASNGSARDALVALTHARDTLLLVAASGDAGRSWHLSSTLSLDGASLVATASSPEGDVAVLLRVAGRLGLVVERGAVGTWQREPPPPPGTGAIALSAGGSPSAFVAHGAELTVAALARGRWATTQQAHVPIQYGSSG